MNGERQAPSRGPNPVVLAAPALAALLFALAAGLARLPLAVPGAGPFAPFHGPLMVSGFLGTVIAAERAAALGRPWAWGAVALNGLGAVLLLVCLATPLAGLVNLLPAGAFLFTAGGVGLVAIFAAIVRREPRLHNMLMALGAAGYLLGNAVLLAGRPVPAAVPAWSAFLVLTITGERLELNRFLRPRRGDTAIVGLGVALLVLGVVTAAVTRPAGDRLLGLAFLVLAGWLGARDIARRTVRMAGQTRYTAICLLAGYVWLAAAGLLWLAHPGATAGPLYDAALHALFVGFVFSMILGHAPIIVPALTGRAVDYRGHFYLPLLLLHGSLAVRLLGDLAALPAWRRWGGALDVAALLLFLAVMVAAVRRGQVD